MPRFKVGNAIVRHPSVYFDNMLGVNTFAPAEARTAAYLLLQWPLVRPDPDVARSEPGRVPGSGDRGVVRGPLVETTYGRSMLGALRDSTAPAPPISNVKGSSKYPQVLDINLQKALSGQSSFTATLKNIASGWNGVTSKHGRERHAAAWRASKGAWPKPGL